MREEGLVLSYFENDGAGVGEVGMVLIENNVEMTCFTNVTTTPKQLMSTNIMIYCTNCSYLLHP